MTSRSTIRTTFLVTFLFAVAAFAGCIGTGGEGQVAVYVKDAATDEFDSVFITFTEVRVHEGDDEDEGDNETEGAGWHTVFEGEEEIDLMAFSEADSRAFLGNESLEAGTYNQIVIDVSSARGITTDGDEVDITVTTDQARVVRAFEVEADSTTRLIIDVDLDRSLHQQGPQGWRMTPVIGQVIVEEDATGTEGDRRDSGAANDDGTSDGTTSDGTTSDSGTTSTDDTGTMTTYVKDAPTDEFSEIWIAFDEVRVHFAGSDGNETSDNETEDDGEWIVVIDTPRELDLLDFQAAGSKAFLGESDLKAGRYTQIEINVTSAWGIDVDDGSRVNITVASETARVTRTFTVEANETTQVVIDLDLDRSLVQTGGQGGREGSWRMTPVIGSVQVEQGVEDDPRTDRRDPDA